MTDLLIILLVLLCAWILFLGFRKPLYILQYPFASTAIFVGWVVPQLVGLVNNYRVPQAALDKTIFMTILCVGAIYVGNRVGNVPLKILNWKFNQRRLLAAATALSLFGGYFFYKVRTLAEEVTAELGGQWVGPITIYVFFATMLTYGLVLALVAFFQRPSRWAVLIILFDLILYFDRIVMWGRRQPAAELAFILGLVFWFHFRKIPSRWAVAAVLVVGVLWVNSVGHYRRVMASESRSFNELLSIDYVKNFQEIFTSGGFELTNAVFDIGGTDYLSSFDLGLSHWNGFISYYLPGQLIGRDLKNDLMIDLGDPARRVFQHVPHIGTTHTGIADAFRSFWYFGAIKFFIISFFMAKFWRAASGGHVVAQMLLMLIFVGALESITHSTDRFFMILPKIVVFLFPALWFAKKRYSQDH